MSRYSQKYTKLKSLDALFEWFLDINLPYFVLYRGFQGERKNRSNCILQNKDISDEAKAWDVLVRNIELQSEDGGEFTVFVSEKANGNYGYTTFLELSNPITPQVGKLPEQPGSYTPYGVGNIEKVIDEKVRVAEERIEMRYQLQRKDEQIEALLNREPEGIRERAIGALLEDIPGTLEKIMGFVVMMRGGNPTAIRSVAGGPPVKENDQPLTEEQYGQRMQSLWAEIMLHIDPLVLLENISEIIKVNPEKVSAFLKDRQQLLFIAKMKT